jgi:hypothetical protein
MLNVCLSKLISYISPLALSDSTVILLLLHRLLLTGIKLFLALASLQLRIFLHLLACLHLFYVVGAFIEIVLTKDLLLAWPIQDVLILCYLLCIVPTTVVHMVLVEILLQVVWNVRGLHRLLF